MIKRPSRFSLGAAALLAALVAAMPIAASAAPIIGGPVVVAGPGDVIAEFTGQTAGYDSWLNLVSPVAIPHIFHNHITPVGTLFNLGSFAPGTELIFSIDVINTGNTFYTGPGVRNFDGIPHNVVDNTGLVTNVGFEDLALAENPDFDYDDLNFRFTNTVPEPSTLALAGLALAAVGAFARRRRAA